MSISRIFISIFSRDLLIWAVNISQGVMIARSLGPDLLGLWILLNLLTSYAESFGRIKVDAAIIYFHGTKKIPISLLFGNVHFFSLISSFVAITSFLLFKPYIFSLFSFPADSAPFDFAFLLIVLQIPFQFALMNNNYICLAIEDFTTFNSAALVKYLSTFVLCFALFLFNNLSLVALAMSSLIGLVLSNFWIFKRLNAIALFKKISLSYDLLVGLVRYGLNFYFGNLISEIQSSSTQLITAAYLNPQAVAFLSQGQSLSGLMSKVSQPLGTILFPKISKMNSSDSHNITLRSFKSMLIILLLTGAILYSIGPSFIVLVYGSDFYSSAIVLKFLIPSYVVFASASVFSSFFAGVGKPHFLVISQLFPSIVQILLAYFLIPLQGLSGACWALSIGFLVSGMANIFLFTYHQRISLLNLVPLKYDFLFIINSLRASLYGK